MNPTVRWIDAEERAMVGAIVGFVGRHTIAFRELPMNLRMKVREQRAVEWCDPRNRSQRVLRRLQIALCFELPRCCDAQPLSLRPILSCCSLIVPFQVDCSMPLASSCIRSLDTSADRCILICRDRLV